jgi:hypothetical protein
MCHRLTNQQLKPKGKRVELFAKARTMCFFGYLNRLRTYEAFAYWLLATVVGNFRGHGGFRIIGKLL